MTLLELSALERLIALNVAHVDVESTGSDDSSFESFLMKWAQLLDLTPNWSPFFKRDSCALTSQKIETASLISRMRVSLSFKRHQCAFMIIDALSALAVENGGEVTARVVPTTGTGEGLRGAGA